MNELEQRPYGGTPAPDDAGIFADNPDPRCPVILLLDRSGSMAGAPIRELNAGLQLLQQQLQADELAAGMGGRRHRRAASSGSLCCPPSKP